MRGSYAKWKLTATKLCIPAPMYLPTREVISTCHKTHQKVVGLSSCKATKRSAKHKNGLIAWSPVGVYKSQYTSYTEKLHLWLLGFVSSADMFLRNVKLKKYAHLGIIPEIWNKYRQPGRTCVGETSSWSSTPSRPQNASIIIYTKQNERGFWMT